MAPARLMRVPFWRAIKQRDRNTNSGGNHVAGGTLGRYLPQGRAGQITAAVLTCLVLALIWRGAVVPAREWYGARTLRLDTARRLLADKRALVAVLPRLRKQLADEDEHNAAGTAARTGGTIGGRMLLPGPSDAVAGAALQGDLQSLAQQNGISLDSAETIAGKAQGALRRIPLRVRMTTSYAKLVGLLAAIGASRPLMLVDRLAIHATSLPDSGASNAGADLPLTAELTVSGFRVTDRPQTASNQ